jgi:spermidine/putrescine-binding protein
MNRFLLLAAAALTAVSAQAQRAELTFRVSALCGMCEQRIEAAYDQKGIVEADYNLETKQLHVVYKTKKWNEESLHKLATGVGHDTDKYKTTDELYANMHGCCKYRDVEHGSCTGHDHDHDHDHDDHR